MLTNKARRVLLVAFAGSLALSVASASDKDKVLTDGYASNEPVRPVLPVENIHTEKARLGKALFNDRHLAGNKLSCADCHQLNSGGDDNAATNNQGQDNRAGINTPTVFNAVYNFRQLWSGAADTLAEQIAMVVHNPNEGATSWPALLQNINKRPSLREQFDRLYADGVTEKNYMDALIEYEKTLVTPNARFDQYLSGDNDAITAEEKAGYHLFKEYGCVSCHQGVNIGGNLFQKFGIFYDYIADRGNITRADHGRKNVTGREQDDFVFKVPSLRNVAVTAPYFHDGQIETLEEAIYIMGKTQLGRELNAKDIELISLFLRTLTGQYQGRFLDDIKLSEAK